MSLRTSSLARGEFGVGHAFGETRADGGRDAAFAGVNGTDGVDQLLARGGFEQIGARAGLD